MKVQIQVEIDISAKAVYRDGAVSLTVTGSMPLAPEQDRAVSSTIDVPLSESESEAFAELFEEAIDTIQAKLLQRVQVGQSEALTVAARMGEL